MQMSQPIENDDTVPIQHPETLLNPSESRIKTVRDMTCVGLGGFILISQVALSIWGETHVSVALVYAGASLLLSVPLFKLGDKAGG
jgi:hypothetical protein